VQGLKQRILTTPLGPAVLEATRWWALFGAIRRNPETAAADANDVIAERLITRLAAPGKVFADVGAHIGSMLSQVRRFDPSVDVVAFEAEPDKARALQQAFPWCKVFAVAVGEAQGEVVLTVNDDTSGYNSIVSGRVVGGRQIPVPLATIDSLVGDEEIDAMKVDVEGAELGVFRGAAGLIDRARPTIMFESVGEGANSLGFSPEAIWDWFRSHDYLLLTPDRVAHDARAMDRDTFIDCHRYPFRTRNYFAVARDRRNEIRDRARGILGIVANAP